MASDDAALVVAVRANVTELDKIMKEAVRTVDKAARDMQKSIEGVGKGTGGGKGGSNVIAVEFGKSAKQIQNDAKVMAYQLNDVFSGLATGQGIRAVQQQVGQISQLLQGQGIVQSAKSIGAAFMTMVNPLNLVLVGLSFGIPLVYDFFFGVEDGADKAAEALSKQADAAKKAADQFGDIVPGLKDAADEFERMKNMADLLAATEFPIALQMKEFVRITSQFDFGSFKVLEGVMKDLTTAGENLRAEMAKGKDGAEQFAEFNRQLAQILEIDGVKGNEALVESIKLIAQWWINAAKAAAGYKAQQDAAQGTRGRLDQGALSDQNFNARFGQQYAKTNRELFPELYREEEERAREAKRKADEAARKQDQESKRAAREAERLHQEAARKLNQAITNQGQTAVDIANSMLGMSEKTNTSELNAFMGNKIDVASQKWCAAFVNASLARVGIKGSGSDVATSFMNWGKEVDFADLQKGDVLVQNRGRSAGQTGGHVGLYTGQQRFNAQGMREIEMISGNSSQKVQKDWVTTSEVIARRATEAFQVPAGALENLTEQSKQASEQAKAHAEMLNQFNQQVAGIIAGGIGTFINDLVEGKDAGEAFTSMMKSMAMQIAQLALQMLVLKPLLGGLFGGMGGGAPLGIGLYHGGGASSHGGRRDGRRFAPAAWAGAERYQSGGWAGFRPGEIPAVLHRGEMIVPNARRLAGTGRGSVDNSVHQQNRITVDVGQSGYVAANSEDGKLVGEKIDKAVQLILVRESRPGGLLRKTPGRT